MSDLVCRMWLGAKVLTGLLLVAPLGAATVFADKTELFTDITAESGIDFVHVNGAYGEKLLPETMGGGVAFFDYDRDGDQDLLFINSNVWPRTPGAEKLRATSALYRNRGDGYFDNVTTETGLDLHLYGMGVAVGDFDADGWDDLYITAVGENRLLKNDSGRRFIDVTAATGVAGSKDDWSTAAAFLDFDRDGDLDILALNYIRWSRDFDLKNPFEIMGLGKAFGPPVRYSGTQALMYENTGGGHFQDVSERLTVTEHDGRPVMKGLGLVILDFDDNGLPDFVVACDSSRNLLFKNLGGGRFQELGREAGIAFDSRGGSTAAMGIDATRSGDGSLLQLAIGNFTFEESSYYVREQGGGFADESLLSGFGPATRDSLTFGVFFFDYDLDGYVDLFHANGHIEPEVATLSSGFRYAQSPQLFRACPEAERTCDRPFVEVDAGASFSAAMVGRGAAYADIDADGDLDVVITSIGGSPRLLRNKQASGNHWLRISLRDPDNRPVLGSVVRLKTAKISKQQRLETTRSYLSVVEPVLTFGLGGSTVVEQLEVTWPDGAVQSVSVTEVDQQIEIQRAVSK